jgi:hypothetical protein
MQRKRRVGLGLITATAGVALLLFGVVIPAAASYASTGTATEMLSLKWQSVSNVPGDCDDYNSQTCAYCPLLGDSGQPSVCNDILKSTGGSGKITWHARFTKTGYNVADNEFNESSGTIYPGQSEVFTFAIQTIGNQPSILVEITGPHNTVDIWYSGQG